MKIFASLMFIGFLFSLSIFADAPPTPVGKQIRIELQQNYPDYQFYIASYNLKVVPNPHPPHPSRPNMIVNVEGSFKLSPINLSVEKPLTETITSARIQYRGSVVGKALWLVAVKRSLGKDVESKIKDAIDNEKNGDGIYTAYLTQALESQKNERVGADVIINKVTKLDESGLSVEVDEGTATLSTNKITSCVALGLLLTGFAFLGMWWTKRKVV